MITAQKARELVALHGRVRPQSPLDWSGPFPLPPVLERFYQEVGPANVTIRTPGNPYHLPCLADLWKFQKGYRYGPRGKPIEDWNEDWIVVADAGGDPLVFEGASNQVLHLYPGETQWDAVTVFPDLNSMAACLAHLGGFRPQAAEHLHDLLGPDSDIETILDALGYD